MFFSRLCLSCVFQFLVDLNLWHLRSWPSTCSGWPLSWSLRAGRQAVQRVVWVFVYRFDDKNSWKHEQNIGRSTLNLEVDNLRFLNY